MVNKRPRGRPTIGAKRRDKYLKIRIMEDTYDTFKNACSELDTNMSKYLTEQIIKLNKNYKEKNGQFKNS